MSQLLRRNMIAAIAPPGVPDADIIVSDRLGSAMAAVQVKARRDIGSDGGWHMKAKHENMKRELLFYFVDFGKVLTDHPKCWTLPRLVVAETLFAAHDAWLKKPGKNGQPHKDGVMRRLLPAYLNPVVQRPLGWLDPYRDAWNQIGKTTAGISN